MINRPKFPKQKQVLIINDVPVKNEISNGDTFSAISNMNLLTAFIKGGLNDPDKDANKIPYGSIGTTYLDYTYYGEGEIEGNFDFNKDFRKRKDLDDRLCLAEVQFHHLPHQKDVYISDRLWQCLQSLLFEITSSKAKLIVTTGKWTLFLLTGCSSLASNTSKPSAPKPFGALAKFRASILQIHECWNIEHKHVFIPMYHTVNIISMPDKVFIFNYDIERICYVYNVIQEKGVEYYIVPEKEFIIADTKEKAFTYLDELLAVLDKGKTLVSIDIEPFFMSTIDCIGLTYETNRGWCIPFASKDNSSLWSIEDEIEILIKLREVLLHKNCLHVGQNYQYDCQYFYKLWGIHVNATHDTMVLHHLLHNKLPKDLAFLASLYCEHYTYWKGEREGTKEDPTTRWIYNCKDVCYTLEILLVLLDILEATEDSSLQDLYSFQMNKLYPQLVKTMNKGIRINVEMKEELYSFFKSMLDKVPQKINELLGFEFNSNSTPQKKKLFKEYFGIELKTNKKKNVGFVETCDAKAMLSYIEEYPLLKPFLMILLEYSAVSKFTSTFLGMKLDDDNRARTQYKITGTAFGRLSSTKNVWGKGGNFQNIPEKGKVPMYYLLQLVEDIESGDSIEDSMEFIEDIEILEGADYEEV